MGLGPWLNDDGERQGFSARYDWENGTKDPSSEPLVNQGQIIETQFKWINIDTSKILKLFHKF